MNSFCIQPSFAGSRESLAIEQYCLKNPKDNTFRFLQKPIQGTIPIGSVEYCEHLLPDYGNQVVNFYPKFLADYQRRSITLQPKHFVKDAKRWKGDKTHVFDDYVYVSEHIKFDNEWRLYVANGQVIVADWYAGDNEEAPLPQLKIQWPAEFSGAVDIGTTELGSVALVEAHPPYACGWYGEGLDDYVVWQIAAWYSFLKHHTKWRFQPGYTATAFNRW